MRTNQPNVARRAHTHEGAPTLAPRKPIDELRRTVLACLLWERSFYESGEDAAARIARLVPLCSPLDVAALAVEARTAMQLRHVPLALVVALAKRVTGTAASCLLADTVEKVIQRADEPGELLSLYWAEAKKADARKRTPIAAGIKRGLAKALQKFDAYQLAKYDRAAAVRLRDVLFLTHAKPRDEEQAAVWKQLVDGKLAAPDTWEVALSAGADKRETFERLIRERRLGYMALLRNLRTMMDVGVDSALVQSELVAKAPRSRALPFRFIAAARACPQLEPALDVAMQAAMQALPRLPGTTVVLVDVSGSMSCSLSSRSDLSRRDAACALAVLVRGIAEQARVFSFSDRTVEVPPRAGMALVDAITRSQPHSSTMLGQAVQDVGRLVPGLDRLIVVTDEQSADVVGAPPCRRGYMVNVAGYQNGVGEAGGWVSLTGFSEQLVAYIAALEGLAAAPAPVVDEAEVAA